MKKNLIALLLALFAITAYAQTGIIREMQGEVEIKTAGTAAFVPAQIGMEVAQNTIVSTGLRSSAVVAVGSNTITVRPLTRLSLAEIQSSAGSENLNISLQTGRVRVEVRPPAGTRASTTVQTPSATASVRGTDFDMNTNTVIVNEGAVLVSGSDGLGVTITGGNTTTVTDTGAVPQNETFMQSLIPDSPAGAESLGGSAGAKEQASSGNIDITIEWQ